MLSQDTTVTPWFKYNILASSATYTGSNEISFTVSGKLAYYDKTTVGGNATTTQKAGSTIVTFADDYLKTLANGTYAVQALYTDGYADTTLTTTYAASQRPAWPARRRVTKAAPRYGLRFA